MLVVSLLLLFSAVVTACGSEGEQADFETYQPEEARMTLVNSDGEEVELFSTSDKSLYLYFTGVDWQICRSQLVELNKHVDELREQGVEVYAISPALPDEHRQLREEEDLGFELLSDTQNLDFGLTYGFIDLEEQVIYRGYVAANPQTEQMAIEVDYLVGENYEQVLETLEQL